MTAVGCNERSMTGCEDGDRQQVGSCKHYGRRMQEDDCRILVENFNWHLAGWERKKIGAKERRGHLSS